MTVRSAGLRVAARGTVTAGLLSAAEVMGFARRLSRGKAGGGGRTSSLRASYVSGMLFGIVEQHLIWKISRR